MPLSSYDLSGTNIPAFLTKLWTLVEDKKYDELIAWDPTGYSFHVYDQTRFAREILPRFFKHNNMASFIRQLNMYGFRKLNSVEQGSLKNEKDDMEFHHPYFVRNKEHLLELIKRKVSTASSSHPVKKEDHEDVDSSSSSLNTNISNSNSNNQNNSQNAAASASSSSKNLQINTENLVAILQGVKSMHAKQADVVDRLQYLKRENEALWKEISTLRTKHHHQQQIVNKLIHFLVHLVNPSSMGIKRSRPLMIDSHSTLTNINNSNINGSSSSSSLLSGLSGSGNGSSGGGTKRAKIIEEEDDDDDNDDLDGLDEPLLKQVRLSAFENSYLNKKNPLTTNKGVIINDITESLLKQPSSLNSPSATSSLSANNNNHNSNSDNLGLSAAAEAGLSSPYAPFVDLVADSPSSIQDDTTDANDFLNSSLFLNADSNYMSDTNSKNDENKNKSDLKSNDDSVSKTLNDATSAAATSPTSDTAMYLLSSPSEHGLKRTISSNFKNYSSQLLDHVESFQFDLNSIKDFLNSNHNVDQSVLSHLFTPSEDYESFQQSLSNAKSSYEPNIETKTSADGRITGTEVVQFEPTLNPELLFIDDFLPNQTSSTTANTNEFLSTPPHLQQQQQSKQQQQQQVTTPTFEDDFLLNDNFTDSIMQQTSITNKILNNSAAAATRLSVKKPSSSKSN